MSSQSEADPLPGEWDGKASDLQRMVIIRCLRPDRFLQAAAKFVSIHLGPKFVDPPSFDMREVYRTSNFKAPLIFVLSPGVDPTKQLVDLAGSIGVKVDSCALGQGQGPVAEKLLENGMANGTWVFLSNCHLMLSWMPVLEKIIDSIADGSGKPCNPEFRMWLSSNPDPKFPISILQRGVKMTTEVRTCVSSGLYRFPNTQAHNPVLGYQCQMHSSSLPVVLQPPRGLRANLLRMYGLISDERFERSDQPFKYRKLLFSLCWFHSLLIERRKFKSLGFTVPYDFNESDFIIRWPSLHPLSRLVTVAIASSTGAC